MTSEDKRPVYIYGLFDTRVGMIRYVGKTVVSIERRRDLHINESIRKQDRKNRNHKICWILKVLREGSNVGVRMIETCNMNNWISREKHWIKELKTSNRLVNTSSGGKGGYFRCTLSYEECKRWVRNNAPKEINSISKWVDYVRNNNLPNFIPVCALNVYKYRGWVSWSDFLGTGNIQSGLKNSNYISYDEFKKWVSKYLSFITNPKEWISYVKNHRLPDFIPNKPYRSYLNKGWLGWYSFFGTEDPKKREYLPYEDAKLWIKDNLGTVSYKEFTSLWRENKIPKSIPLKPKRHYKNEFLGCWDFLNSEKKKSKEFYWSYNDSKNYVHSLNIKSNKEWRVWIKTKTNKNIPKNPVYIYKEEWISWYDWLGKETP